GGALEGEFEAVGELAQGRGGRVGVGGGEGGGEGAEDAVRLLGGEGAEAGLGLDRGAGALGLLLLPLQQAAALGGVGVAEEGEVAVEGGDVSPGSVAAQVGLQAPHGGGAG